MPWIFCGVGIAYCLTGLFLFYKNVYEKDKKLWPSVMLILMGVVLITIGTAFYFHLFE
ncbi:MAG TPA: hypothetical protein VIQ00_14050 [Chitinophagaceae bacterium]